MIELREGSPLAVPHDGPMPWVARIMLRRTDVGGRLLPGLGGEEECARFTLDSDTVAQIGGPERIPDALEKDRRWWARVASKAGYGTGWAVEVDVTRGHKRRLWTVSVDGGSDASV